jgi:putative methyltransferase (TIGR04325 family)
MRFDTALLSFARSVIPDSLVHYARSSFGLFVNRIQFMGDFKSWSEADKEAAGYDQKHILDKTLEAVRKVINGEMAFERDGVPFPRMQYNFPLLSALMRIAERHGRLHVLDFGGSLGSTYFQSRGRLNSCPDLRWAVVEQASHVAVGNKEFANEELSFYDSIESACKDNEYDVLLLSGVLQYLPDPLTFLSSIVGRRIPAIIIDRTPFMVNGVARLTVQHVPKRIYSASYPAWFFSEHEFLAKFETQYENIATWSALDKHHPQGGRAEYKGFLFELRKASLIQ